MQNSNDKPAPAPLPKNDELLGMDEEGQPVYIARLASNAPAVAVPPHCWAHWTENPKRGVTKLYASPTPPNKHTNPNWKPHEYLSLIEHERIVAELREEIVEYFDALYAHSHHAKGFAELRRLLLDQKAEIVKKMETMALRELAREALAKLEGEK